MIQTVRALGLRRIARLYRAYRWGWVDIISGFYTTRSLQALFNVGFFDEMKSRGAVDCDTFAVEKNLDPVILKSLCDSLYALAILKRNGRGYSLDARGRILADVARGWFLATYGYESVFHDLEALLKKEKQYGRDVRPRSELVARGASEMEEWLHFPIAIDIIHKRGYRKVLDIGCGDGAFLRALCNVSPEIVGCGMDIAIETVERGRELVRDAGLERRLQLLAADISDLDERPEVLREVDVATTFLLLHEMLFEGNDPAVRFLKRFRRLFPGVPLMVFEVLRPTADEMRRRPGMSVQYMLQHDLTRQRPIGRDEWMGLFREAGFRSVQEKHIGLARTAIFTVC